MTLHTCGWQVCVLGSTHVWLNGPLQVCGPVGQVWVVPLQVCALEPAQLAPLQAGAI